MFYLELSKKNKHHLRNVLHVPKLFTNLVSIQKLTKDLGCNVILYQTHCIFYDQNLGKISRLAKERNGLYYLETPSKAFVSLLYEHHLFNKEKIQLHHCRLGHPLFRTIKILFPSLFRKLDVESFHCEVCVLAKHKRLTFSISNTRSLEPFHLIHSDIWCPSPIPNIYGACCFVSFIDDCPRVSQIFLLKHKSDVSFVLPNFHNMIENQFDVTIKRFQSNNTRVYFNQVLTPYFHHEVHESSRVNTPTTKWSY